MSDSNQLKRFDDYTPTVDCEDCTHWWGNSCDGVKKGSRKPCTSFIATRNVVIPAKIKALQRGLKWLTVGVSVMFVLLIILIILLEVKV